MAEQVPTDELEPIEPEVPEEQPEETEVHPLEPGGQRFSKVYADMQEAQREAARLREELAAARAAAKPPEPAKPPATFYTVQQLEKMVADGTVTLAQAQDQLEWQREQKLLATVEKKTAEREILTSANREVDEYLKLVPGLNDPTSKPFREVASASQEIAQETGLDIRDPRVIKRALRETLGKLDTVKTRYQDREAERKGASPPADVGARRPETNGAKVDPLKNVPKMYLDHWKRLGYDEKQMREEAQYITPVRR